MYLRIDCIILYLNTFFPTKPHFICNPKPLFIPHQGIFELFTIFGNYE